MGGGVGNSSSIRWRMKSGNPSIKGSNPGQDQKITIEEDAQGNRKLKECVAFDQNDQGPLKLRVRLKSGTWEEFAKTAKPVGDNVWELEIEPDKKDDQIQVSWGQPDVWSQPPKRP
ncbi:MAG: hypothetical protein HYU37_02165 [Acidobacteria bacterium]|nr:hypothetical protein [Acidobacteriota bacterium]